MVYEITDAADNRRLFYGTGPIHVAVGQNVILRLAGPQRHEVSEPFSAADRDPGQERFGTLRDYFKGCHGMQYPASLRVRVVICDHRTGRMALLYHSGKTAKRHAKVRVLPRPPFLSPSIPPYLFFSVCVYPASLRVRVVICDHWMGRMALLYHSGKTAKRHAKVRSSLFPPSFPPFLFPSLTALSVE